MNKAILAATTALFLIELALPAAAEKWFEVEPRIWKAVHALPGESPWQTCHRNFRYDTTQIAHGSGNIIYCYVPYSYIYGPGQSRQNFNQ